MTRREKIAIIFNKGKWKYVLLFIAALAYAIYHRITVSPDSCQHRICAGDIAFFVMYIAIVHYDNALLAQRGTLSELIEQAYIKEIEELEDYIEELEQQIPNTEDPITNKGG